MMFLLAPIAALASPTPAMEMLDALAPTLNEVASEDCAETLGVLVHDLQRVDTKQLDSHFVADHPDALGRLWSVHRLAEDRLRSLHREGEVSEACVDGFRRLDMALRYGADHLMLAEANGNGWLTSPELQSFGDLRAGDVLVSRGDALSSAGIAHIGAVDTAFSHNAMVHQDDEGRLWTVEAYLERGGVVQPLEDFLEHGVARVAVVRFEDEELAATAAAAAFRRIAEGPEIGYDEAFDDTDHDELFCSEIVPWAMGLVGGPEDVPLHRTRFDHQGTPRLFSDMGIAGPDLAAPADVLVDPRFRVVGEWRDLSMVKELHRQDAVVDGLFRWMSERGLSPEPTWTHRTTVRVGRAVRRAPVVGGLLQARIHPDGDLDFLVTALALQDAGQRIDDQLVLDAEQAWTREELDAHVDAALRTDARRHARKPRRSAVHHVLRSSATARR